MWRSRGNSSLAPPSDHYVQMHSLSFKLLRGHLSPLVALVVSKNGLAFLVLKAFHLDSYLGFVWCTVNLRDGSNDLIDFCVA